MMQPSLGQGSYLYENGMSEYVVDVSVESPVIRYVTLVVWFVLLLMCHDLWIDGVMITQYITFSDSSVRVYNLR